MNGSPVTIHAECRPMRGAPVVGLALAMLIAGCSSVTPASPGAQPPSATAAVAPTPAPSPPKTALATPSGTAAVAPASPVAPPVLASQSAANVAPAAKAPVAAATNAPATAAAKAPAAQAAKKESAVPEVAKKASPTLNLASLEQRLKDTKAIGVLTKIEIKSQVDDLLDEFRAFYSGKVKTTLAELRRPYDLLVLKVLSLLQDSDPSLASAIVASREAIWGILADPKKFATI